MAFLNYVLVAIIAAIGLICGYFIAKIAKEELKEGRKYFIFLKRILLALILFFLLLGFEVYILLSLIVSVLFLFFILYFFKNIVKKNVLIYLILALVFFFSVKTKFFLIISSLIFIYGFPTGSLMFYQKKKEMALARPLIVFLIIAILLYLIF